MRTGVAGTDARDDGNDGLGDRLARRSQLPTTQPDWHAFSSKQWLTREPDAVSGE
jgi:hypothetical protein